MLINVSRNVCCMSTNLPYLNDHFRLTNDNFGRYFFSRNQHKPSHCFRHLCFQHLNPQSCLHCCYSHYYWCHCFHCCHYRCHFHVVDLDSYSKAMHFVMNRRHLIEQEHFSGWACRVSLTLSLSTKVFYASTGSCLIQIRIRS